MIEVELIGVSVEMPSNTPIVAVQDFENNRMLSILIGAPEATAISFALEGISTKRPLTHDLMLLSFAELGVEIEKVEITDLVEGTFFAELTLENALGTHVVGCRPSDALALAARAGCPVFVAESVMDEASIPAPPPEDPSEDPDGPEPEAVVEEFRQFIESIDPEDFDS